MNILSTQKNTSTVNPNRLLILGSLSSLVIASALALGLINPWTEKDNYKYEDKTYLNAGASIVAVETGSATDVVAASETEKSYKVHVTLPAGAGSLSEETNYVGEIKDTDALPKTLDLSLADKNWEPVGSESEGTLEVKQWDRQALKGKLFSYPLNARSVKIKSDAE